MQTGLNMISRRKFIELAGAGIAVGGLPSLRSSLATEMRPTSRIKAIAFDAFPIFDPRPILGMAERLFPGHGDALSAERRMRQFEYSWLPEATYGNSTRLGVWPLHQESSENNRIRCWLGISAAA